MKKRILAMLLTVCMVFSMLPMSALAARVDDVPLAALPEGEETHDHDHAHEVARPADATDAAQLAEVTEESAVNTSSLVKGAYLDHNGNYGTSTTQTAAAVLKLYKFESETATTCTLVEDAADLTSGSYYCILSDYKLLYANNNATNKCTKTTSFTGAANDFSCHGDNHKFKLVKDETSGLWTIQSKASEKYLTLSGKKIGTHENLSVVTQPDGYSHFVIDKVDGGFTIAFAPAHLQPAPQLPGYTRITSTTELNADSSYLIVGQSSAGDLYALSPFKDSVGSGALTAGNATARFLVPLSKTEPSAPLFTIEPSGGGYTVKANDLYLVMELNATTAGMFNESSRVLEVEANPNGDFTFSHDNTGGGGVRQLALNVKNDPYSYSNNLNFLTYATDFWGPNPKYNFPIYLYEKKTSELLTVSQLIKSGAMEGAINRDDNGVTENQLYEGTEDAFINFGPATGWGNTVASDAALTLDFGQVKEVDRIRIVVGNSDENRWWSYKLEYSQNGKDWEQIGENFSEATSGKSEHDMTLGTPVNARYLRLYNLASHPSGNKWSWFGRFAAWGANDIGETRTVTIVDGDTTTDYPVAWGADFPDYPTSKDGYTFLGWYTADGELFDGNTPVVEDITVHAEWRRTALYEANANGTWDIEPTQGGEVIYPSEETSGEQTNGRGAQAYDEDSSTYWHTQYNPNHTAADTEEGRWIGIDFGDTPRQVSGFRYLLRQQENGSEAGGTVYDYRIEISDSGEDGTWKAISKGTWTYTSSDITNEGWKSVNFPTVTTKQIRLVGVRTKNGPYMTAAEIRAIGPDTPVLTVESFTHPDGLWNVSAEEEAKLYTEGADHAVWYTVRQGQDWDPNNNKSLAGDYLCLDFGSVKEVQQVRAVVGADGTSGDKWEQYALEYSVDGETWTQINEYTGVTSGKDVQNERLNTPVLARYLRLVNKTDKATWVKFSKFIAFGDNDPTLDTYTVTFNADGGEVTPATAQVVLGNTVGELPTPTKTGYTFLGWFNGETAFTADTVVTGNIEVTAKWAVDETTAVAMIGEDYYPTLQAAIDAAMDGQTVEVIKDAVGAVLTESKSVTVNVREGVTVSPAETKTYALAVAGEGAVLTVTGSGAIQGTTYGVVAQQKGALNVSENFTGTISGETGLRCATEAVANVHNGTITSTKANGMVVSTGRSDNRGTIHVYGGTFANVDGTAYDMHSRPNVTVHYTYFYQNETGKVIELTEENSEAKLGDVLYHTLLEAVLKAPANTPATITLLNHVDLRDHMEPVDDGEKVPMPYVEIYDDINITLDLNGKTLRAPLINHGILTITGNGTVDASDTNDNLGYLYPAVQNYKAPDAETDLMPHTIIENGTFVSGKGEVCCVYDQAGTIEIKGGSFTATNNQPAVRKIGNDTKVEISGGTFSSDVTAFCAENKKATTEDNTVWTIVDKSYVARIGDTKYETLTEALVAATAGQTVTLLKGDAQTIDLANYADGLTDVTLTAAQDVTCAGITVTGTGSMTGFTFKNIDFNSTGHCVSFNTNATVEGITFDGCSFTCAGKNDHDNIAIHMYGGTTAIPYTNVVVRDCEFTHCGQGVYVNTVNGLTVTGCTFTDIGEYNADGPAIHPGDVAANGTITITGNTFIDCIKSPLVMFQLGEDATVQVNNNTFTHIGGRYMLMTKAGEEEKVTFSGNTWDGLTLTADENFNPVLNGSGGVRFGVTPVVEVYKGDVVNDAYLAYILASVDSAVYFANKEDLKTLYFVAEGTYDISGLTVDNVNITAADELEVTHNDDGTVTVTPKTYVAQIGDTKYETLEAALNAADGTMPVTLLADVTEDATLDSGVSVTLNTGDYTVKATVFVENGTLTFNGKSDTAYEGRGHEGTADNNFIVKNGANLIVTDGKIKSGCTAVYVENGEATIQDGTFSANGPWGTKYLLNLKDKAETASITVEGGAFEDYDPANSASENPKMDFVAPQYAATKGENGVYTVAEAVAQVTSLATDKTKGYASVEAAIDAAGLGDTVTVMKKPEGPIVIGNDKAVQLNFNERVDPQTVDVDFQANANINLGAGSNLYGGLEACVKAEDILRKGNSSGRTYFYLYKNVTLTEDIVLPARASSTSAIFTAADVTIDLAGHTISQKKGDGWNGYPAVGAYSGNLTIKDTDETGNVTGTGKIIGATIGADVYPGKTLTFESGTITSEGDRYEPWTTSYGAVVRLYGGEFVMNGGTLSNDAATDTMSGTIVFVNGDPEQSFYNDATYKLTINGGRIESVSNHVEGNNGFHSIADSVDTTQEGKINYAITGGTFGLDLTGKADAAGNPYLDNTKYWALEGTEAGTWTVKEKTVAKIGDATYHSLQAAIDAATDGDTVTLLKDVTESVTVTGDKEITLNIPEGMTLTNEAGKHTITVAEGGSLIITGAGTVDNVSDKKAALLNYGDVTLGLYNETQEDGCITITRSKETGVDANTSGGNSYYTIDNHGYMMIDAATISQTGAYSSLIRNVGVESDDPFEMRGTLNINKEVRLIGGLNNIKNDEWGALWIGGGTFEKAAQYSVMNWSAAEIDSNDATFDKPVWNGVYTEGGKTPGVGELNISGGNFNGDPAVKVKDGNVSITGGTFATDVNDWCLNNGEQGGYCWHTEDHTVSTHTVEPVWSKDGDTHWHECSRCGNHFDEAAHTWGEWTTVTTATCAVKGSEKRTCSVCGEKGTRETEIDPDNHVGETEIRDAVDATCTTEGYTGDTYCLDCNTKIADGETIDAKGHAWDEGEVTTAATCTTDGEKTFTCTREGCGATKTEVISATGHTMTHHTAVAATCTTAGNVEYWSCDRCNKNFSDENGIVVATNVTRPATGHTEVASADNKPATCTEAGLTGKTECSVCHVVLDEGTMIAATGHNTDGVIGHRDATCTEDGVVGGTYCTVCENGKAAAETVIPATGHDMTKHEAVAATCTEEGNVEYWSCANCDKNFADEAGTVELETVVTEALGHDFTKFAFDENGHWHVCAHEGCEERMPDEEPAAHTWDAGVVSGNIRTFTCECGATRTQTISTGGGGGRPTTPTPPEEDLNEPDVPLAKPFLFTDVTENDWFYEAVKDVFEKGLMEGINAEGTLFAPYQITTRGVVATLIHRMENTPAAEKPSNFSDVEDGMWYTEAIHWTDESGVMIGYDDGNFYPNQAVTREQLVLVLYRYAKFRGYDVSTKGDLSLFDDAEDVSSWALDGMTWAVGSSLINGRNGTNLAPQGTATRAELATILQRFVSLMADADTQGE